MRVPLGVFGVLCALAKDEQQRVDSSTPLINSLITSTSGPSSSAGSMSTSLSLNDTGPPTQNGRGGRIGLAGPGTSGLVQAASGNLEPEAPAARRNVRFNIMDDGVRGMNLSRLGLLLLMMVNLPLIAAGIVVLTLHWGDSVPCDSGQRQKWRWWALLSVVRMVLSTPVTAVSGVLYMNMSIDTSYLVRYIHAALRRKRQAAAISARCAQGSLM